MKQRRVRWTTMLALLAGGSSLLSCSGEVSREFRDALITGATNFLTSQTTQWLTEAFADDE